MRITQGIISREEALKLAPQYVSFIDDKQNWDVWKVVISLFNRLRRNQSVLTYVDGKYVKGRITVVNHKSPQAIDGPLVRVSNGEYSWRVDGDQYAYPILGS